MADPERLVALLNDTATGRFEYAYFDDLTYFMTPERVEFRNERTGKLLDDYDGVYIRHWGLPESQGQGLAVAHYCKLKKIPFTDNEAWRVGSLNKLTQYINLHEAKVPFPTTFIAQSERILEGVERYDFSYPFILKATSGTRGQDNFLIHDKQELETTLNRYDATSFVVQEYVENDGDLRVFVVGDTAKLVIRRKAQAGTHLNNTSMGGEAQIIPIDQIPQSVLDDSVKAAKFFGRDIAGVDMVIAKDGRHYCFEVNRAPQIEHSSFEAEKTSALADYLISLS